MIAKQLLRYQGNFNLYKRVSNIYIYIVGWLYRSKTYFGVFVRNKLIVKIAVY